MLHTAKSLEGRELRARDGNIGHVADVFFDDEHWRIRYFIVDTGGWLSDRRVLISPAAITGAAGADGALPVDLTREQVRQSPGVEVEQPVSREDELALTNYYNWPTYWTMAGMADGNLGMTVPQPLLAPESLLPVREARVAHSAVAEHHLRSVRRVRGFELTARDGAIGPVTDFIVDDADWRIAALVVDTQKLWPIMHVLVPPSHVEHLGWEETKVHVSVAAERVKTSPAYAPAESPLEEHVARSAAYYDRLDAPTEGDRS